MINVGWFLVVVGLVLWAYLAYYQLVRPLILAAHKHLIGDEEDGLDQQSDEP